MDIFQKENFSFKMLILSTAKHLIHFIKRSSGPYDDFSTHMR